MEWTDGLIRFGSVRMPSLPIGWERESGRKPGGLRTHLLGVTGFFSYQAVAVAFDHVPGDPGCAGVGRYRE